MHEAQVAGDQPDGKDGHDRTVEPLDEGVRTERRRRCARRERRRLPSERGHPVDGTAVDPVRRPDRVCVWAGLSADTRTGGLGRRRRSRRTCCRPDRRPDRAPDDPEGEIALDVRGLLRPGNPQPARRVERPSQGGSRRRRSAGVLVKSSATSSGPRADRANVVPVGTAPREKPLGAPTTRTREPSRVRACARAASPSSPCARSASRSEL